MGMSDLEATFDYYWRLCDGGELVAEYRFGAELAGGAGKGLRRRLEDANARDWRFDRSAPDVQIAIELEGGTWNGGRHNRPAGYADDCEKYNRAALAGWLVFRFTSDMLAGDPAGHLEPVVRLIRERREAQ